MKPAIVYLRVSTSEQGRSGLGLAAQEAAVRQFAQAEGFEITAVLTEVSSGKNGLDARPVLKDALARAKKLKAPVLVAKLDRLSREVAFVSGLMASKVPFFVANLGVDVDPMMLHIYAAVGQKEREMIGERTKSALAAKRAADPSWKPGPKTTLGAHKRKEALSRGSQSGFKAADEFASRVRPMMKQYQASGMSLAGIAEQMNMLGVNTARGGQWYATTVVRVLGRTA